MTPKYMLDTNICIDLMKHHPPEVAERFAQCYFGDVVISAITLAELEYGVLCSGDNEAKKRLAWLAGWKTWLLRPLGQARPRLTGQSGSPTANAARMP
jgi:predicted nucleic acid-binding protein